MAGGHRRQGAARDTEVEGEGLVGGKEQAPGWDGKGSGAKAALNSDPACRASGPLLSSLTSSEQACLISLHLPESLSRDHRAPYFNHALE
ncbi:hypothetical protein GOODEAATRI_002637 [Goodea atripinnis]|uniref:Uncharacterized protein n=1 Tax=Goodea atripinnis TaxID=208336 RepID=A0ABV0MEJ9_9TELE